MTKKRRKSAGVLHGHRRQGKRFVPPMMQLPSVDLSVTYVTHMLPELVWIGLLNQKMGYVRAARLLERLFTLVGETKDPDTKGNFALVSTFGLLRDEQKNVLRDRLREEETLTLLQEVTAPLNLLYDNCPLLFLGPPARVFERYELVSIVKKCVGETIDKYKTPGILLNGALMLFSLITKQLHFSKDIDLPDFNSVVNAPDSEEAKHAAGMMRAYALTEFGMRNVDPSWARHFWNRNAQLSPCEFSKPEVSDGDEE